VKLENTRMERKRNKSMYDRYICGLFETGIISKDA
jgi:hypothetical protein